MEAICSFRIEGTIVANEFIDRYMAAASGEYVKVYLYLLRHQPGQVDIGQIADALDYTESDVKRALAYWEKAGILRQRQDTPPAPTVSFSVTAEPAPFSDQPVPSRSPVFSGLPPVSHPSPASNLASPASNLASPASNLASPASNLASSAPNLASSDPDLAAMPTQADETSSLPAMDDSASHPLSRRPMYSQEQVNRLADDEDFTQLLYIAQKYMDKVFTPRECEVFAYMYDGLGMTAELLEYLVEYCVQSGHTSIRYIETVGLNWHDRGFATAEEARAFASGFIKDSFAVMRCFGLTDRKPGDAEKRMMEKWFSVYGFSKELILEACNRTLEATHSPSFRYADKILAEWKKGGVKTIQDVARMDEKHQGKKSARSAKKPANQFHNFEQRSTDYDSMVLDQVKSWIGKS